MVSYIPLDPQKPMKNEGFSSLKYGLYRLYPLKMMESRGFPWVRVRTNYHWSIPSPLLDPSTWFTWTSSTQVFLFALAFFMRVEKWENMATQMGKWMDYVGKFIHHPHFLSAFFCKKMEFDFFWSQKKTKCRNVPSIVPSRAHIIDASHRYDGQIESESKHLAMARSSVQWDVFQMPSIQKSWYSEVLLDPKCHGNLQEISWKKCQGRK